MADKQLVFHSEEVQEIMGRRPAWILRWGITILILIIVGIIVGSYFIKYPQTITANIVLTSNNPPSDLAARTSGIIDTLFIADGDTLFSGQILALIDSPAEYHDIVDSERLLNDIDSSRLIVSTMNLLLSIDYHLGSLQTDWIDFQSILSDYANYISINQVGEKKTLLAEQVVHAKEYYSRLLTQRESLLEEFHYERRSLDRDSILYSRKSISEVEYEASRKAYIARRNTLEGFDASLENAILNCLQLEQQIDELETQRSTAIAEYKRRIIHQKDYLIGRIALWKEQYTIIAPFDGVVSLQNVWGEGQRVNAGDVVASITPLKQQQIIGRLKIPSSGFGKVSVGQKVNIKLNGFPYLEFGLLKGEVATISSVPESTLEGLFYTATIILPDGLVSTYHTPFPFVQNMDGTAEIITEDMRLIEQFVKPIRSLFVN